MNELQSKGSVADRVRTLLLSLALPARLPPLSAVVAGAMVLWFSFPTLASLHSIWLTTYDYTHGHLVLVLTAVLVVREMGRGRGAPVVSSWAGFACLLALMLVVMVGHASTTSIVAQLALPALWMAAVWAFAGAQNARRFALPLSYLYFAIPVWSLLIEPMRILTIRVVSAWIRAAGLPAFIEGNLIHVPTGTFEVQGGCAGLRYMLVAIALAAFASLLHRQRWTPTLLLTLGALVLALVGNWLRVFITVAAGLSPEGLVLQLVHDHHTEFGWVLFVVFILPIFYLDRMLQSRSSAPAVEAAAVDLHTLATRRKTAAYAAYAVLASAIWLSHGINEGEADEPPATAVFLAPEIAGWDRTVLWQDARLPVFDGAGTQAAAWYVNGVAHIGAYVAHYPRQGKQHEVVDNQPAGQSGVVVARHTLVTATASGATLPFQELEVSDSGGERRLVWLGLRVAGKPATSDVVAKALQVYGVITSRRDAQALVLTANCDGTCTEARSWLSRYAMAAAEPLYEHAQRPMGGQQAPHDSDHGARR